MFALLALYATEEEQWDLEEGTRKDHISLEPSSAALHYYSILTNLARYNRSKMISFIVLLYVVPKSSDNGAPLLCLHLSLTTPASSYGHWSVQVVGVAEESTRSWLFRYYSTVVHDAHHKAVIHFE